MLKISRNSKQYTIDLTVKPLNEHVLPIKSVDGNGNSLSWGVEFKTTPYIDVSSNGKNEMIINLTVGDIVNEEYIVLKNYLGERFKVYIKPNLETLREKLYTFRFDNPVISGKNLSIDIISTESGNEIPWICSYEGKPLSYKISPLKSEHSGTVNIELQGEVFNEYHSMIKFTQDDSLNELTLKLLQTNNSVKIEEAG